MSVVPGLVGVQAAQYKFTDNGKPGPAALAPPWVQTPINIVPSQQVAKFTYNSSGQIVGTSSTSTSPITQALCQLHTTPTLRNQILVADMITATNPTTAPQLTMVLAQSLTTLEHYSVQIAFGPITAGVIAIGNVQLAYSSPAGVNTSLANNGPYTVPLPARLMFAWTPNLANGLRLDFLGPIVPGTTKFYPSAVPALVGNTSGHPLTSGDNTEMLLRVSPAVATTFSFSAVMGHAYNGNPPVPYT